MEPDNRDLLPFTTDTRALVTSNTDVGGGNQVLLPKVLDGVEVRALCRPVQFFHNILRNPSIYGAGFVHGGHCHVETEKGQT